MSKNNKLTREYLRELWESNEKNLEIVLVAIGVFNFDYKDFSVGTWARCVD